MILPYVVKLFDAPDVPLPVRRTALETVDHFADYLDLTDYTSKIMHPLVGFLLLWSGELGMQVCVGVLLVFAAVEMG